MAHLFDANSGMDEGCASAPEVRWRREDVHGDKLLDLVFFFDVQSLNLTSRSTDAIFMAHGAYGPSLLHIMGTDTVKVKD